MGGHGVDLIDDGGESVDVPDHGVAMPGAGEAVLVREGVNLPKDLFALQTEDGQGGSNFVGDSRSHLPQEGEFGRLDQTTEILVPDFFRLRTSFCSNGPKPGMTPH